MPRFHIKDSFQITGRKLFYLRGTILDGEIRAGMEIQFRLNSQTAMTAAIHSIELARALDGSVVCLGIECADQTELDFWIGMNLKDETVDISGPTPAL